MTSDPTRTRVSKGRRPGPGADPRVDTLVGMVMALTSEVAILRERLDTHEKLSADGQNIDSETVDQYHPEPGDEERRAVMRNRLIDKVCRPLLAAGQDGAND